MVPKLMLDGMPYELQEITASDLDQRSSQACLHLQNNLIKLEMKNKGSPKGLDNGYWISFVEIMDSNGDWFVPTVQYAFHVFQTFDNRGPDGNEIYNMFEIKNIYVRNTQGDNEWKLVNRTHGFGGHSRPIPDDNQVAQGVRRGRYGAAASENSYIWTTVDAIDPSNWRQVGTFRGPGPSYVVSEWTDISSFAYRELLLRDIDPEEGELKMLIQVADDTNKFQAAINKEAI